MTPIHEQLLESLKELEILCESIVHANELSIRLDNEEREFAMLDKMLSREQRDVDVLEQIGITSLLRRMIGDREERIEEEREEYDRVSKRHIELSNPLS
jgi:hypothetical protein